MEPLLKQSTLVKKRLRLARVQRREKGVLQIPAVEQRQWIIRLQIHGVNCSFFAA